MLAKLGTDLIDFSEHKTAQAVSIDSVYRCLFRLRLAVDETCMAALSGCSHSLIPREEYRVTGH